jgi:hypothetical protein
VYDLPDFDYSQIHAWLRRISQTKPSEIVSTHIGPSSIYTFYPWPRRIEDQEGVPCISLPIDLHEKMYSSHQVAEVANLSLLPKRVGL